LQEWTGIDPLRRFFRIHFPGIPLLGATSTQVELLAGYLNLVGRLKNPSAIRLNLPTQPRLSNIDAERILFVLSTQSDEDKRRRGHVLSRVDFTTGDLVLIAIDTGAKIEDSYRSNR